MKGLFLDAVDDLADVFRRVVRPDDPPVDVREQADVAPDELPGLLRRLRFRAGRPHADARPTPCRRCAGLKHVIFLGTGARSYMNPEELAEHRHHRPHHQGLRRHGGRRARDRADVGRRARSGADGPRDARGQLDADRGTRSSPARRSACWVSAASRRKWRGSPAARGMRVLAWNRTPKSAPGVTFVDLDTLLAESHVLSVHLLLNDETRGFLSPSGLARLRPGAILVNTARGALVDEAAMIAALRSGRIGHAALDVFDDGAAAARA